MNTSARLDQTFYALADPTRRELLRLLEQGPATVSDLAKRFKQSLPGISKHLKVLAGAGLLDIRAHPQDGRAKTCQLQAAGLEEVRCWVEDSQAAWNRRFDAMERILAKDAKKGKR
jgi:DNA-binding transcriptional ArsR family regulator